MTLVTRPPTLSKAALVDPKRFVRRADQLCSLWYSWDASLFSANVTVGDRSQTLTLDGAETARLAATSLGAVRHMVRSQERAPNASFVEEHYVTLNPGTEHAVRNAYRRFEDAARLMVEYAATGKHFSYHIERA